MRRAMVKYHRTVFLRDNDNIGKRRVAGSQFAPCWGLGYHRLDAGQTD